MARTRAAAIRACSRTRPAIAELMTATTRKITSASNS